MGYNFTLTKMVITKKEITKLKKDMKTLESSYIATEHVKFCRHFGKLFGSVHT